jgi:endonuclease
LLYDRPVRTLMREAASDLPMPTSPAAVVNWFGLKYPLVKKTTVAAHIKGLTANDPNRHHYSVHRYEPVFTWTQDGRLAAYDPDTDLGDEDVSSEDEGVDDEEDKQPVSPATTEFVLEAHLEEFLLGNWNAVNWGRPLRLWQGQDGASGHQLVTSIGRLDLLCVDTSSSALVVVELKRGHSADRVVGQVARYMGWVRTHLAAAGQDVQGIVVAHEYDDRLRYAATAVPGLTILTYHVTFHLEPVPGVLASGISEVPVRRVVRVADGADEDAIPHQIAFPALGAAPERELVGELARVRYPDPVERCGDLRPRSAKTGGSDCAGRPEPWWSGPPGVRSRGWTMKSPTPTGTGYLRGIQDPRCSIALKRPEASPTRTSRRGSRGKTGSAHPRRTR